ncbi:MAG: hypothetical protein ACD_7C00086G0011 [uncultured bacterium]|nr:MAG: hypothetical protein ACD_7C00086G0011 [uncultured bacterium]HBR78902.1 hypothetical protein [Candidatus Moranbacteria bacterium]
MNKLEKLAIINPTNEFHILRHFAFVKDTYKKSLINKHYWYWDYSQEKFIAAYISPDDIKYALETIGTKFYKNIVGIENPRKLLKLIKEKFRELDLKNEIRWVDEEERSLTSFSFEYDCPVGDMNCISIDKLSVEDRKRTKAALRSKCVGEDNIMINIVSEIELQSTRMICVEIVETKQLPFFAITAFPACSVNNNSAGDDDIVFMI